MSSTHDTDMAATVIVYCHYRGDFVARKKSWHCMVEIEIHVPVYMYMYYMQY